MRTEYFDCFKAALEYKNFALAAESLYMSPSAFTKMIKSLEEQLGGTLFVRKGKNQRELSPFGKYMSPYLLQNCNSTAELLNAASAFSGTQQNILFISMFQQVPSLPNIKILLEVRKKYPDLHYKMIQTDHMNLNHLLRNSLTEICLAYSELIHSHIDYEEVLLLKDPLVLIANNSTAEKKNWKNQVYMPDLHNVPFYFPSEDMALHNFTISACNRAGFSPYMDSYSEVQFDTILRLIQQTDLCTLVPRSFAKTAESFDDLAVIPIRDAPVLSLCIYMDVLHTKKVKNYVMHYFQNCYSADPV